MDLPSDHVRWRRPAPTLERPVMLIAFEGWSDAGDAATGAAAHLADRWDARPIADIDPEAFYDFSATRPIVHLDDDSRRYIEWPTNTVRIGRVEGRDVVFMIGAEPQLRWRTFCEQVIVVARALNVERIISLGALLAEVPHTRPVEIYGTTTDQALIDGLELSASTYEGPTGILGVLTDAFAKAHFSTTSFWAAVPSYVPGATSPRATLALVERICASIGCSVYLTDLEIAAATYDRQINDLVGEDTDTLDYVTRLEAVWDEEAEGDEPDLDNDPETLVAEVEEFLRDRPA